MVKSKEPSKTIFENRRPFYFRRPFWHHWVLCSVLQFTINLPFLVFRATRLKGRNDHPKSPILTPKSPTRKHHPTLMHGSESRMILVQFWIARRYFLHSKVSEKYIFRLRKNVKIIDINYAKKKTGKRVITFYQEKRHENMTRFYPPKYDIFIKYDEKIYPKIHRKVLRKFSARIVYFFG
jgi:hypothetical protein